MSSCILIEEPGFDGMFGRGIKHCSTRRSNKFIRRKIHASQSCLKKLSCQGIANKNPDIVKAGLLIPRDCISYIAGSVSVIASLASCYLVCRMAKYSYAWIATLKHHPRCSFDSFWSIVHRIYLPATHVAPENSWLEGDPFLLGFGPRGQLAVSV